MVALFLLIELVTKLLSMYLLESLKLWIMLNAGSITEMIQKATQLCTATQMSDRTSFARIGKLPQNTIQQNLSLSYANGSPVRHEPSAKASPMFVRCFQQMKGSKQCPQ